MADETPTPQTGTTPPDGTSQNPLVVTLAPGGGAGGPVIPTPGLDETVPGGAYRVGDQWVNAYGEPIKAPKNRG